MLVERREKWLGFPKEKPKEKNEKNDRAIASSRLLDVGAAILAGAVLGDSAVEHYRGSFQNRAMYTPLAVASLALIASLSGATDRSPRSHRGRDAIYGLSAATGIAGLAFHIYNVIKRPGGVSWLNLFYAAPVGAPAALALAGLFGRGAERVREGKTTLFGLPAARVLAAISALGLAGTVSEAGLLHFRGAFQNPAMLLPVTLPPVAAALTGAAAIKPSPLGIRLARWWLKATAMLGFAGVGFHAYGVSRSMGGWRNWSQNVPNGPPLPAPPSFTGLALTALAALALLDGDHDE